MQVSKLRERLNHGIYDVSVGDDGLCLYSVVSTAVTMTMTMTATMGVATTTTAAAMVGSCLGRSKLGDSGC